MPDGLHPDKQYIDRVKPGGWGKVPMIITFCKHTERDEAVFAAVGFETTLLEYFDERGTFHYQKWSPADGIIERSSRYDSRNRAREWTYTSIILDARTPQKPIRRLAAA